eukprot:10090694-Lingulodinium_polyedra.AAC.1
MVPRSPEGRPPCPRETQTRVWEAPHLGTGGLGQRPSPFFGLLKNRFGVLKCNVRGFVALGPWALCVVSVLPV